MPTWLPWLALGVVAIAAGGLATIAYRLATAGANHQAPADLPVKPSRADRMTEPSVLAARDDFDRKRARQLRGGVGWHP